MMSEVDQSPVRHSSNHLQKQNEIYCLDEKSSASEEKQQEYRKELQQYFLYGIKTSDGQLINTSTAWFKSIVNNEDVELDFPIFYSFENRDFLSLDRHVEETFSKIPLSDEAMTLAQCKQRIVAEIRENMDQQDTSFDYQFQIKEAFKTLRETEIDSVDADLFKKRCDQFESELLSTNGTLITFSGQTVFELLNLQLALQKIIHQEFQQILTKAISGLHEILILQNDDLADTSIPFDFAKDLVSFDKIADISMSRVSSSFPAERLERLRHAHQILQQALKSFTENGASIFTTQEISKKFELAGILSDSTLIISKNPSGLAREKYTKEINNFVQVIAALRLTDLVINQTYDAELHTPYFEGFDRSHLSDEDIRYFQSPIIIAESRQLTRDQDLLTVLSYDTFVKVLAINYLDDLHNITDKNGENESYLELAALAQFRRNAYIFQGGADTPSRLNKALRRGMDATTPVLWNILLTKPESGEKRNDLLKLKLAMESRYFPRLEYDREAGDDFSSHFDLTGNRGPECDFPAINLEVKSKSKIQTITCGLTPAHFLAVDPINLAKLEILPSWFESEDLMTLDQYLSKSRDENAGKIPFTWLVDDQDILRRTVIPIPWLRYCRFRLDYWHFLQAVSGVKRVHEQQVIEEERSKWETARKADLEALKIQLQESFAQKRTEDLERAIKKILYALLDPDIDIGVLSFPPAQFIDPASQIANNLDEPQKQVNNSEVQEKTPVVQSEVWIESDLCTSCSDCTDALPGVFKYNDDKRAIVHNPQGASYAKIVATAEKCPARCIHPGLPHDKSEADLDKLIKRAEKYQ